MNKILAKLFYYFFGSAASNSGANTYGVTGSEGSGTITLPLGGYVHQYVPTKRQPKWWEYWKTQRITGRGSFAYVVTASVGHGFVITPAQQDDEILMLLSMD